MAALRERAASADIRLDDTLRFFWHVYPYCIEFDAAKHVKATLSPSQRFRARTIHQEVLSGLQIDGRTTSRRSGLCTCVYFTEEADALAFLDVVAASAVRVSAPLNESAVAVLTRDGTRVKPRLRDRLFWNKYAYRIEFKDRIDDNGQMERIHDWLQDFAEVTDTQDRIEFHYSSPRSAYFAEENDLLFFKLVFHEQISKIEKAFLIKDIANEPLVAEDAG